MNDSTQPLALKAAALAARFDMKLLWFLAVSTLQFVGEVYRVYPSFLRFIGQKLQSKRASFASGSVQQAGQCSNFGISFRKKHTQSEISLSQLPAGWSQAPFVVPDAKLIFCPQFKVGTTEFVRLLRWVDGQDYNVHPHFKVGDRWGNLTTLADFGPKAALQMMLDSAWIKLVIVRDPLDRLRSAYLDKIKGKHSKTSQREFADALNVRIPTLSKLSFAAFVRRVEAQMKKNVSNVHWRMQAQRCGLEHFKKYYQYVLHMGLDKTTHPALRDCVLRAMTSRMNKSKLSTLQHIVVSDETRSRLQAHETDSSLEKMDEIYDEATCNIALRIYTEDYDLFSLPRPTCHKTSPHVRWPV